MTETQNPVEASIADATDDDDVTSLSGAMAALLARMPESARLEAERLGPLSRDEQRGNLEAERRAALRSARQRLWGEVVHGWPDDDFTAVSMSKLAADQHPRLLAAFLGSAKRIAIISGPTGRGKTYAAFATADLAASTGLYVNAISHKRYLDSLEPNGSDEPSWLLRRRAYNPDVLVVDDLGAEMDPTQPASEFRTRETCDLLSARLKPGKKTIITTNLSPQELAVMFGGRIVSRLNQECLPLLIRGEDRRAGALGVTWGA